MIHGSNGYGFRLGLVAGLLAATAATRAAPRWPLGPSRQLAQAEARVAWRVRLPLKFTASIRSYHLLDEYLYAVGTDGDVRAIRADTGEHVWTRQLAEPETKLPPPVAYRSPHLNAVAFTRVDEVVFVEPATGREIGEMERDGEGETLSPIVGPVRLGSGTLASVAVSREYVFAAAPGHRVRRYDIADNYQSWQVATPGLLRLAPVYLARHNLLLIADGSGLVAGISGSDKSKRFSRQLEGKPVGWLTADDKAVYVATTGPRLYALDLATGEVQPVGGADGSFRLPGQPTGGPIVTETSVYQATSDGLQRVRKEPKWRNWLAGEAKCFLAEWPNRVVLLRRDGRIAFVAPETGASQAVIDLSGDFDGVSNVRNDAVIVTSPRGEIYCVRPLGARRLTPSDFRPVPAPPLEAPAVEGEPVAEEEPETPEAAEVPPEKEEPAETAGPRMTLEERLIANPLRSRR